MPRLYDKALAPPDPRLLGALFAIGILFLPFSALASGGGDGHQVIGNIALCMVAASVLGFTMKILRQPLILGYLLAGVAIGPVGLQFITDHSAIVTVAEIGLILLLFMIGLEIDLKRMLAAGKLVILTGLLQFPICVGLGYLAFWGLSNAGMNLGGGKYAVLYLSLAIGISSTMIVVKLLYDKMELDTLPGRITVGILVFQDIWAIIVLAIQPNLLDPQITGLLKTFGAGILLVVAALVVSKYVLPFVFRLVAKLPELMLVISLGWCFLVCLVAAHKYVGLSMEMGALIAGVSLATFPYNLDVIAKVISIRDFFITLFFVALGMQIPTPELRVVGLAFLVVGMALAVRGFGIFGVLYALRAGQRVSHLTTINLSQISEFSLVILTLGVGFKHIQTETLTVAIWAFSILAVVSTYFINFSHPLQRLMTSILRRLGFKDLGEEEKAAEKKPEPPIVILGFFRIAGAFVDEVARSHQHLLEQIMVVDFNPQVRERLESMGVHCVYGDVSSMDTLHHAEIEHAKVILSTVPDSILKGTNNMNLLRTLRGMCPHAQIIVTAESPINARTLYAAGADYVIQPSTVTGRSMVPAVEQALAAGLEDMREEATELLAQQKDLLAAHEGSDK